MPAVLVITLILGACPTDTGTSTEKPSAPSNPPPVMKLSLSGQVYTQDINLDPENIDLGGSLFFNPNLASIKKYNDSLSIDDGGIGGLGEIINGKLSYIIETPELLPIGESLSYLKGMYSGLNFSPADANASAVILQITDSEEYSGLLKGLLTVNLVPVITRFPPPPAVTAISIVITIKTVNYVYVDKALNITADPFSYDYTDPELPFPIGLTSDRINLRLREGWNPLYSEIKAQVDIPLDMIPELMMPSDPDSPGPDLSALRPKGNLKMSVGEPGNLNWILIPSQSSDIVEPEYPGRPEYPDF